MEGILEIKGEPCSSSGYETDIEGCMTPARGVLACHRRGPRRRDRARFSRHQVQVLEGMFRSTKYPDITLREQVARTLEVSEDRVQVWFQNRRCKFRRTLLSSPPSEVNKSRFTLNTSVLSPPISDRLSPPERNSPQHPLQHSPIDLSNSSPNTNNNSSMSIPVSRNINAGASLNSPCHDKSTSSFYRPWEKTGCSSDLTIPQRHTLSLSAFPQTQLTSLPLVAFPGAVLAGQFPCYMTSYGNGPVISPRMYSCNSF